MVIIETYKFKTFEDYLASLSKSGRKNWRFAQKNNPVSYKAETGSNENSVGRNLIQWWMDLWSQQLIRGQRREFAFSAMELQGKNIICFRASENKVGVAFQFVEVIDGYMNCHPVMYEKEKYSQRYLSKFMWFNLIKWAIENKIKIVDLGGGIDDDWREMIRRRAEFPNPAYKWLYVPKAVKDNPEEQQNYRVEHYGISKRIYKID